MLRMASIGGTTRTSPLSTVQIPTTPDIYGQSTQLTQHNPSLSPSGSYQASTLPDGTSHPHHYIPGGYIFSPHNGDTGLSGHVYWTHYHAGVWITDHGHIWDELVWENGIPEPERGFQAISELAPSHTLGYYLPAGPYWIDDPATELGYDMADCWASCMIPFDWGLQYDPRGFVFISEMVSGVYVVQFDEDYDARYDYPPLWTAEASDQ